MVQEEYDNIKQNKDKEENELMNRMKKHEIQYRIMEDQLNHL